MASRLTAPIHRSTVALFVGAFSLLVMAGVLQPTGGASPPPANAHLLARNNLGMHCIGSDDSIFSILPPYNSIRSQLIRNGQLVKDTSGIAVNNAEHHEPGAGTVATKVPEASPPDAPFVQDGSLWIASDVPGSVTLMGSDADGPKQTLGSVSQRSHGTLALSNNTATLFPVTGITGGDSFPFAASDGLSDSKRGTVFFTIGAGGGAPTLAMSLSSRVVQNPSPERAREIFVVDEKDRRRRSKECRRCRSDEVYSKKIRAQLGGVSHSPARGTLTDSPKAGTDAVTASGIYTFLTASPDRSIQLAAEAVTLQIGTANSPLTIAIPANSVGWKHQKNRWTRTPAKGAHPKARVILDLDKKTFSITAGQFDFADPSRIRSEYL